MPYHQIHKLPSTLFSVFPPVTMKAKTSLPSCTVSYPFTFSRSSSFLHHESLLLDYSRSMQTCFCLPSTQNQNNSLDPHTLFQLPPFSLTSKLVYTNRLHFLTSHFLLYHLIFCPYCFLKLFLSVKISNGSILSNPMDSFYSY